MKTKWLLFIDNNSWSRMYYRIIQFSAIILILYLVLCTPLAVRADIAPPGKPPGVNPVPNDENTQVRMMAEIVSIDVQSKTPPGSLGQADVRAQFTMRNLGNQAEEMAVRFPLAINDGFFNYPEILDLRVWVNGEQVKTRRITITNDDVDDYPYPWAEFPVEFPPGEDTLIEVAYTLEGAGEYPYISYNYLLETGAGWQGTIGSADLVLSLPYEANQHNIILDEQIGWSLTTPTAELEENEVRWHYDDLEPTSENNLQVSLVMPEAWAKVLVERANVERNPQDGEAWGRLGKVYKEISRLRRGIRADAGGQELFELSVDAYDKAVTLLPEDAVWHGGYAEMLWNYYYWEVFFVDPAKMEMMQRALLELARSLEINPKTVITHQILDDISYAMPEAVVKDGDQYILLLLTATPIFPPTATETALPSLTPIPHTVTDTLPPTRTPTSTPHETSLPIETTNAVINSDNDQPTSNPGFSFCGSLILVPIMLLMARRFY